MRKDQSRPPLNTRCNSLPRSKILRGKRNFERLFKQSSVLHSSYLQFRYHLLEDSVKEIKIGFIAPKRIMKKAVSRNRAKRRLRESYRNHQHILTDFFSECPGGVHGVFISKKEDIPFCDINAEVEQLLLGLTKKISSQSKQKDQNEPSTSHKII